LTLKALLETSFSSTTFSNEVLAEDVWIERKGERKQRRQSVNSAALAASLLGCLAADVDLLDVSPFEPRSHREQ
jgi:hypothetical protein